MGLAFTGGPISYRLIPANNSAELMGGIHDAVVFAGWAAEQLSDGYKYTITSPQGLKAKVTVRDRSERCHFRPCLTVRWMNETETLQGPDHHLVYESGRQYRLVANQCQLFMCVPGVYLRGYPGATLAGGIPWVPNAWSEQCAYDPGPNQATWEAWWSQGDCNVNGIDSSESLRYWYAPAWHARFAGCHNGDLRNSMVRCVANEQVLLRLIPIAAPYEWPSWPFGVASEVKWFDGRYLKLDPLIAWASGQNDLAARVRGQLWDAMIVSVQRPLDAEETVDDMDWYSFTYTGEGATDGAYFCSLYLLRNKPQGSGPVLGNYAY